MQAQAADLLKVLGSGVRPGAGAPTAPAAAGFAELLEQARAGQLETGLPVSVAQGAGLSLSPGQLDGLAKAVDRAHAEGATRIVVLMDGMSLDVDVLGRRVLGAADLSGGRVLTGIDGLVRLDDHGEGEFTPLPLPRAGALNPSLLEALHAGPSLGSA